MSIQIASAPQSISRVARFTGNCWNTAFVMSGKYALVFVPSYRSSVSACVSPIVDTGLPAGGPAVPQHLVFQIEGVPEPGTLAVISLALAALAARRRRK